MTKICKNCGSILLKGYQNRLYCDKHCRNKFTHRAGLNRKKLVFSKIKQMHPHAKGTMGELIVATDLLSEGFTVFRPVGSTAPFDLVAYKAGCMLRVEVTTACYQKENGQIYYSKMRYEADILALVLPEGDIVYDPPLDTGLKQYAKDIRGFRTRTVIKTAC